MLTDRRQFMLSVLFAAAFGGVDRALAEEDRALFWRIKTRDSGSCTIFGYGPIAASLVPDVVKDGERMVEEASRVLLDMNNFTLPKVNVGKLPPLLPRLGAPVAAELRKVLAGLGMTQPQIESSPGLTIGLALAGEGQTRPVPSVGGVIVDRAVALKRSIMTLLAEDEVKQLTKPIDWVALNNAVDEKFIAFLLELRRQVGPVGAHSDTLYRERKSEELHRFSSALADHGSPIPGILGKDAVDLLFSRLSGSLTASPCFVLAPIGTLMEPEGILARFRRQGADVSVVA